jgi:hypothetical protein
VSTTPPTWWVLRARLTGAKIPTYTCTKLYYHATLRSQIPRVRYQATQSEGAAEKRQIALRSRPSSGQKSHVSLLFLFLYSRRHLASTTPSTLEAVALQGTFGIIQGTFGIIQGTFGLIRGTFGAQGEGGGAAAAGRGRLSPRATSAWPSRGRSG